MADLNYNIKLDLTEANVYFNAFPKKMEFVVNNIVKKGILLVERYAKQLAPVDTGRLRASIGGGSFKGGSFSDGTGRSFGNLEASIRPFVNYAIYQELGTRRMQAHPFMGPAVDRVRQEIEGIANDELKALL